MKVRYSTFNITFKKLYMQTSKTQEKMKYYLKEIKRKVRSEREKKQERGRCTGKIKTIENTRTLAHFFLTYNNLNLFLTF